MSIHYCIFTTKSLFSIHPHIFDLSFPFHPPPTMFPSGNHLSAVCISVCFVLLVLLKNTLLETLKNGVCTHTEHKHRCSSPCRREHKPDVHLPQLSSDRFLPVPSSQARFRLSNVIGDTNSCCRSFSSAKLEVKTEMSQLVLMGSSPSSWIRFSFLTPNSCLSPS